MQTISNLARKLARQLFPATAAQESFLASLQESQPYSPALIWLDQRPSQHPFHVLPPLDWLPEFVDRLAAGQRPGQHPLHESGAFYCLDVSSAFAATALLGIPMPARRVIDVCAAPGGKSVFAWRALQPDLLVANETIKKRTGALIANLNRCDVQPVVVTIMDSARLAEACPHSADVVIVDAPCSGQSLVARGKPAPGCFHPATINMNANRQRRILANAARLVENNGWLVYITCTYARKENEGNLEWLLKSHPELTAVEIAPLAPFHSTLADVPCYRMWPQDGIGAGGFVALLQRRGGGDDGTLRLETLRVAWQR